MKKRTMRLLLLLVAIVTVMLASTAIANAATYNYTLEGRSNAFGNLSITSDRDLNSNDSRSLSDSANFKANLTFKSAEGTYISLIFVDGEEVYDNAKNNHEKLNLQSILLDFKKWGSHSFVVHVEGPNFESDEYSREIYILPSAPSSKIGITTMADRMFFNFYGVDQEKSGSGIVVVLPNGKQYVVKAGEGTFVKATAGKSVKVKLYGLVEDQKYGDLPGVKYITKTVKMGPTVKPVIKSIKISNVKVKKYFDSDRWEYRYKTSWTATVTLSKKAAGIKGIELNDGLDGSYKKAGTGKTFKINMSRDAQYSYKGVKMNMSVNTYSDKTYGAYSNKSNVKKVTIK